MVSSVRSLGQATARGSSAAERGNWHPLFLLRRWQLLRLGHRAVALVLRQPSVTAFSESSYSRPAGALYFSASLSHELNPNQSAHMHLELAKTRSVGESVGPFGGAKDVSLQQTKNPGRTRRRTHEQPRSTRSKSCHGMFIPQCLLCVLRRNKQPSVAIFHTC